MVRINAKLGLRPAGKRSIMKLPHDRALRNKVTSATCPNCLRQGVARLSRIHTDTLRCDVCNQEWPVPSE